MHTPQGSNSIMCSIFDQRFSNIISVIVTTCWQNNPQYKIVCSRKFYVSIWKCSSQPVSFYFFKSQTEPAWQAFEREGKGSFRCERNARGARGGRERNACKETIVFLVFNIHQANVKILIGQSSKHVSHSLNTLIG